MASPISHLEAKLKETLGCEPNDRLTALSALAQRKAPAPDKLRGLRPTI